MKHLLSVLLLLVTFSPVFASEQTIFESVVKVHSGNSYGTGTCINIDDQYVYIITNKHVVGENRGVNVQFYRNGHESSEINANVIWSAYRQNEPVDIALLAVSRKKLNWTPTVVKFELDDKVYSVGETTLTIGCPKAEWPRAYKGHITKVESDGTYLITPTVVPGQSGSVLFNGDGTKAIGLIAWYEGDYGKAMTAEVIQKAATGKHSNYYLKQKSYSNDHEFYDLKDTDRNPVEAQFFRPYNDGGGDCPGGTCPNCRPQDQEPPQRTRPSQRPRNEQPSDDENLPEGIKIFPTYPDQDEPDADPDAAPDRPSTPKQPTTPKLDEKYNDLEKRLGVLEGTTKDNTTKIGELSTKLTEVDIKASKVRTDLDVANGKLDKIGEQVTGLDTKITDLATKIDTKPEATDVVTPGRLDDFIKEQEAKIQALQKDVVKSDDIADINTGLQTKLKEVITDVNKNQESLTKRIDSAVGEQSKTALAIIKEMNTTTATQVATTPGNIYNDYGKTAVGTGIPSIILLIIGYWFKKIAEKYFGLPGGSASQLPFPQTPGIAASLKK